MIAQGASFWPLQVARELDDAILHLRINELDTAMLVFKSHGDRANVLACDAFLEAHKAHWLVNEIRQYWKRVLKRIDVTSRTLVTLGRARLMLRRHPGRTGVRRRPLLHADRPEAGRQPQRPDHRTVGDEFRALSDEPRPDPPAIALPGRSVRCRNARRRAIGKAIDAEEAEALGLVTFALDDIDWDDEIRVFFEERASFSPDSLTGMEANLRFVGPETMESKIFSRLTAWQNWIFQRPNAVGEDGALRRYGTGQKAQFDMTRV